MKKFWIPFSGKSMSPLLVDLDHVLVESVSLSDLKRGDIVLFLDKDSRELTLHRLIALPFLTKGDFCLLVDSDSSEGFLGRALGYERRNIYRKFPAHDSFFTKAFVSLSRVRMTGSFKRKFALLQLFLLVIFFELLCEKTRSDRSKGPLINDP